MYRFVMLVKSGMVLKWLLASTFGNLMPKRKLLSFLGILFINLNDEFVCTGSFCQ